MAFDENLAERLRAQLAETGGIEEKAMFGGVSFMLRGNMAVGVIEDELCVRVGPEAHEESVDLPGARIFDFTGRPTKGWLLVGAEGYDDDGDLAAWVQRGLDFAGSLEPK